MKSPCHFLFSHRGTSELNWKLFLAEWKSKLCYDRRLVGLGVKHPSGSYDQIFITVRQLPGFFYVGRPLWRENGSAVYNYCWSSPAQSFLGPSPAGLVIIFYCRLKFETPPTWRARSPYLYPPRTGWPSYTPRHWVPFRRLLRLTRLRWRYSNSPPRGRDLAASGLCYVAQTTQKTQVTW
jgi:hypothetical protein